MEPQIKTPRAMRMHILWCLLLMALTSEAYYGGGYRHYLMERGEPLTDSYNSQERWWLPCPELAPSNCTYGSYYNNACKRNECFRGPNERCTERLKYENFNERCAHGLWCDRFTGRCDAPSKVDVDFPTRFELPQRRWLSE